ncbi:MAG: response regulator [Planctomycetaceae bacterium]|nr:response regulator [Planctomycetaceae bacterium]
MTKLKVLIVDDEPNIVNACKRLLRGAGFEVIGSTDVHEALKIVASQEIAVVISDQRMPDMTGAKFLSIIKELSPETTRLILTGYADIEAAISAINDGHVYQYLTKPWDEEGILKAVEEAAQLHQKYLKSVSFNRSTRQKILSLEMINSELRAQLEGQTS